jgi:hypothetical protein
MRIVSLEHDLPEDSNYDGPFQIDESFTSIEVHIDHKTVIQKGKVFPEEDVPPEVIKILDFREREVHAKLIEHINRGENGPNNWLKPHVTPTESNPITATMSVNSSVAIDQHLISSFYDNYNKVKE